MGGLGIRLMEVFNLVLVVNKYGDYELIFRFLLVIIYRVKY